MTLRHLLARLEDLGHRRPLGLSMALVGLAWLGSLAALAGLSELLGILNTSAG